MSTLVFTDKRSFDSGISARYDELTKWHLRLETLFVLIDNHVNEWHRAVSNIFPIYS